MVLVNQISDHSHEISFNLRKLKTSSESSNAVLNPMGKVLINQYVWLTILQEKLIQIW